ncbi:amidohydrolase family protein [soil metagenome]
MIRNARIVSAFGAAVGEVDVEIADGLIQAVGPGLEGRGETLDAEGRWLMPGLWDHHTHLTQWTLNRRRTDLSGTRSPSEVLEVVTAALVANPGSPVVAHSMKAGEWDRMPRVSDLDAVSGSVPVVCLNVDLHQAWLNTAAQRFFGLEPVDVFVTENTLYAIEARLVDLESRPSDADFAAMLADAVALGVTGLVDFEHSTDPADWPGRAGCDLVRIRWNTYENGLDGVIAAGLRTGDRLGGLVTVGGLKIISDGSLGTRTAWCCEPYADTGGYGAANQSTADLVDLLAAATAHGLEVATHAIGDRANAEALAAYAATGAKGSIEHAQLVRPQDISTMASLGLRASVQPSHLLDDRDQATRVWPGRDEDCYAFRAMLEAGVRVVFGSDAPVAPLDPWLSISAAVHRSNDERDPWGPGQAVSVAEALRASVMTTVAAGQPADLILLEADPMTAAPAQLRTMPVSHTIVAGRTVHGG